MFKKPIFLALSLLICFSCSGKETENEGGDPGDGELVVRDGKDLVGYVKYTDGAPAVGIVVSDGYSAAATDQYGIYQLTRHADARHVMFSYPENCRIKISERGTPDFFRDLPEGVTDVVRQDFTLEKLTGEVPREFTFYAIADPHISHEEGRFERFIDETVTDLNRSLQRQDKPTVAVVLGDVGDWNVDDFKEIAALFKDIDTPCFQTYGNHDSDSKKVPDVEGRSWNLRMLKHFEDAFNPVNYSFNFGDVHFVVLNNVQNPAEGEGYNQDITDEQIAWLREDLRYVPATKALFVCLHIPIRNRSFSNRDALMEAIRPFANVRIFSGHTHVNSTWSQSECGGTEHVIGAACGLWWFGTICADGSPNGYAVFNVEGTDIRDWIYKSVGYDDDFQARIYKSANFSGWNNDTWRNRVVCNVWNCTARDWSVQLYENGQMTKQMQRVASDKDYSVEDWLRNEHGREADNVGGLFFAEPNDPGAEIKIRITDPFGNVYWQDRITTDYSAYIEYPTQ